MIVFMGLPKTTQTMFVLQVAQSLYDVTTIPCGSTQSIFGLV